MSFDKELYDAFLPLWGDLENEAASPQKRPLLAHYTSIATLENIMISNELWFSNPLYMNDLEELRFGIQEGAIAFRQHPELKAACPNGRYQKLLAEFEILFDRFESKDAFDTYVFCMTEHDDQTTDGLLSMWRAYGSSGNGAAIILDTRQLTFHRQLPGLFLSKVNYHPHEERANWINNKILEFAKLLTEINVPEEQLRVPVHLFFERLKIFSLFTKHHGFSEEREWRVVYLRDYDTDKLLHGMLHYAMGPNGIEPKLKLKINPLPGITGDDFLLTNLVSQILLGPTISNHLAQMCVRRMLDTVGKPELANKLAGSTIPFRGTSFKP